ncbi:hypothetical protein GMB86_11235 [Terrilactibacillus sp. BCM23-1]|uniref:Uncharacterized protein n=1 Tax=Terrilactibacillus tamarindi TaxID=2599694 RepID=A0A6N8CRB1_9BACI|nr:hypothetical protein [Terrilactibacillus tamarindi]MTT32581.1 hypothetical protein [Terrilactibacillus tamarindi]
MKKTVLFVGGMVALGLLLIFAWKFAQTNSNSHKKTSIETKIEALNWQKNGKNGEYITKRHEGMITTKMEGIIQTDTDCSPDSKGISRCHNKIKLSNNKEVSVINIHNMKTYSCFKPGQKVTVEPLNQKWFKVIKVN